MTLPAIVITSGEPAGIGPELCAMLASRQAAQRSTARSLREAHGQIALQAPAIAFVDLQLPDGNGMSLLEQDGPLTEAEVVLLTQIRDALTRA